MDAIFMTNDEMDYAVSFRTTAEPAKRRDMSSRARRTTAARYSRCRSTAGQGAHRRCNKGTGL